MSIENLKLTKEIAEKFVQDEDSIDLTIYKAIDDDAAAILGAHKGHILRLFGLKEISEEGVKSLSSFKRYLFLGIDKLSEAEALALANHSGPLILDSLEVLPDNIAYILSKHQGDLSFNSVEDLSQESAVALSKLNGSLGLALKSLTPELGDILAEHVGELDLSEIENINVGLSNLLEKHKGQVILNEDICEKINDNIPLPENAVEIGIIPEEIPYYKGVSTFRICWELDVNVIENAGINGDWATASVKYNFSKGIAYQLEIIDELVERGLAIPYLDSVIRVESLSDNDEILWKWEQGEIDPEIIDFSEVNIDEIIRKVHAHAIELKKI